LILVKGGRVNPYGPNGRLTFLRGTVSPTPNFGTLANSAFHPFWALLNIFGKNEGTHLKFDKQIVFGK